MLRRGARLRPLGHVRDRCPPHRRSARVSSRQGLTMHEITTDSTLPKPALYAEVVAQTRALLEGERDAIANFANTTSLLYHSLPDLNWVGFYLRKDGELVVGPFQGKPACVRIAVGKGVCGTAAARRAPVIVENVHEFDGHIACCLLYTSDAADERSSVDLGGR